MKYPLILNGQYYKTVDLPEGLFKHYESEGKVFEGTIIKVPGNREITRKVYFCECEEEEGG